MSNDDTSTPGVLEDEKSAWSLDDYEIKHAEFVPDYNYLPALTRKWYDLGEYHKQMRAFLASPDAIPLPDVRLLVGAADRPELQALGPARRLSIEIDPRDGTRLVGMRFADSTKGDLRDTRVFDGPVAFVFLCLWLPGSGGSLNPRKKLGTGPLYGYHSWGSLKAYWRRLIANAPVNCREVDPPKGELFPFDHRSYLIRDFGSRQPLLSGQHQSWVGREQATTAATARYRERGTKHILPHSERELRQMLVDGFAAVDYLWAAVEDIAYVSG